VPGAALAAADAGTAPIATPPASTRATAARHALARRMELPKIDISRSR
jgi:hypothetical protein